MEQERVEVTAARGGTYAERARRQVRPYDPWAHDAVLQLRRQAWGDSPQAGAPFFNWLYEGPMGAGLWTVENGGAVVAVQGAIGIRLMVGGRPLKGAWLVELFVDPSQRFRGLGALMTQVAVGGFDVTLGVELSEEAYRTFGRLGWTDLGTVPLWARPLDLARVLRARGPAALHGAALAVGPAQHVADAFLDATLATAGLEAKEVSRFGAEVDRLFDTASLRFEVIARRDAATLNAHFAEYPEPGRYRLLTFHDRGRLVGWAVLRMGERHGLPAGYVVDLLTERRWFLPVVGRCLSILRRDGAAMAYIVHASPEADDLRWLGFTRRDTGWRLMVHETGLPRETRARLSRPDAYYLTAGDSNMDRPR